MRNLFYQVPYNDAQRLEDVLKKHSDSIAAVLIEPILGNCCGIPSKPEFIKAVRALCTKYNVIMIVDEVKTGFRVGKGGAQALYGIEADIFTVAKAVANGYPISAIGGKEEIMRKYGKGVGPWRAPTLPQAMSLAAAEKTLTILRDTDALEVIANYGKAMQGRHAQGALEARHPAQLHRSLFDVRPVLLGRGADHLPQLEAQRLHLLRHDGRLSHRHGR